MIRRPRPLPPRDQWRPSAPVPAEGDRIRALAAADPGMAVSPHAERSPVRQRQWAAARAADRAETSGVGSAECGPEIAAQPAAPAPLPEWPPTDPEPTRRPALYDPEPLDIPRGDPGADLDAAIRDAFCRASATGALGIRPVPRSPVDPGPHDAEPAVPRWRWWTRWTNRTRKREG